MQKRKPKPENNDHASGPTGSTPQAKRAAKRSSAVRAAPSRSTVLLVDANTAALDAARAALEAVGHTCVCARSLADARQAMARTDFEVAVIDTDVTGERGLTLVDEIHASGGATRTIVTSTRSALECAVEAMRHGAADFISKPAAPGDLVSRVVAAAELARRARAEQRRVARLERACRRLSAAREEVSRQVDVLCGDLANAYEEIAGQLSNTSVAAEFGAIAREELDVETLLRRTLEYLLKKVGPTNAAVFLPTGQDDFSLGAYVNYDVPRDTADVLLDHLADVLAPRIEGRAEMVRPANDPELREMLGEHAGWLDGSDLVTFACEHDGECLAIVALFRDRTRPLGNELDGTLDIIRRVFAMQMARVIKVHHRLSMHQDKPGFSVDGFDDAGDMAA